MAGYCIIVVGITLISLALCADGVIGNVQEKAMKQHGASNTEMVRLSFFLITGTRTTGFYSLVRNHV
jgi:hypothetical protein